MDFISVGAIELWPFCHLVVAPQRDDGQIQFLIESFLLSMIGGILGVLLGLGLSYALCRVIGMTFFISTDAIVLGVAFSAAVGIVFGWAPARKASKLNPIDALRAV